MNKFLRSGLLLVAACLICAGSGCSRGGAKIVNFPLYDQDGVKLTLPSISSAENGSGGYIVTISGIQIVIPPNVHNERHRVTLFDDTNGNGVHDAGERIYGQEGSTPPPGTPPPGAGTGQPPAINTPINLGGTGNITAWIEIEYTDESGNPVLNRFSKSVKFKK